MSTPGQEVVTLQINYGRIGKKEENNWEIKKIDYIILEFTKAPKDFKILTWYPGSPWTLIKSVINFTETKIEIKLKGVKASSIMIQFEKGHTFPEFSNMVAYAIKQVEVGTYSHRILIDKCDQITKKKGRKEFDFDSQYETKTPHKESYEKVSAEALTTFQSLIKAYKIMKAYKYYVEKAKLTANTLKKRLDDLGNNVIERSMKLMQEFYSKKLLKSTNPEFDTYLERLENKKMDQNSNDSNVSVVGEADSNPGENCYQIKTINRSVLSGFYWIKPDCTPKAIRVFCDFSVFGDAVDIFVTSGEKTESNPDLSEWKIENEKSIGYRCANYGLFPIEIRSPQMLGRIINIVEYLGYDLTMPQVIPLGYDYDCEKKCSKEFKSFSSKDSKPINTYFSEKNENNKSETGTMAGIGFGNINSMKIFDPKKIKITAIVCSTNVFQKDDKEDISQVNCEKTVSGNANEFPSNNNKVILCENGCNMSSAPVYGNGLFDGKSSICKSAIYDGKLTSSGGKIVLSIKEPIKGNEYNTLITGGGQQNGIQSDKNFKNDGSTPFSFEPYDPECPINNYLTDTQKDLNDANSRSSFIESGFNSDNFSLDELSDEQLNKMTLHGKPLKDIANLLEYEPRFNEGIFGKAIDKVKNWFGKKKQELPNVDVKQQVEDAKNAAKKGLDETIRQANKGAEVAKDTMTKMEDSARESAKKLVNTEENPFAPKQNFSTETQKSAAKKLEEQAKKKVEEEEEATDDKPKPKNCSPTTSKGIAVLKSIFKNSDYKKLGKFKENIAQIQKAMDNFSETTAWAEKSSELSNFQLYLLYYKMVRQSNELVSRLRRTVSISDARIQKTDFYKKKWMKRLMKLNRFDKFSPETPKINLKEEFSVKNYKSMDLATPEWKFVTQNIKKRATAFGLVGKYKPKEGMFGSMLIQKTRNLYDAEIKVDILVTSEGITGLVFKFIDRFNFYALVINTQTSDNKNYKAIVKMNQGKLTTLNKIEDGGILINNWHKIKLNTISNSFIIEVQDLENKSPKKTLMATDADFVQGKVGFFSTNTEGVYFDKFSISSHTCWQPWQPRADLEIRTNSVNIYHEEFLGNLETKYDLIEPNNTENGPMKFKLNYVETPGEDAGLNQLKATYDTSQLRKPVMAINKKVMYTSGIYKVGFKGLDAGGAVSIIFKYNVFGAKKAEIFYCFDLIDTIDNTNRYVLRKFENNTAQTLVTVNNLNDNKITSNGFQLGYKQSKKVKVIVNCNRNNIVIKISFDGSDLVKVLDYKDKFPIKSGLVGVGTHATRVNFYSIETTPFVGILTESAVSNYLSSDNERILPGVTSDSGSDDEESNNSGPGEIQSGTWRNAAGGDDKKSKDSKEKSQDKKKDCKEKRKQNDFGAAECSKTRSEIEKFDYCHRKYEDDNARKVCKVGLLIFRGTSVMLAALERRKMDHCELIV